MNGRWILQRVRSAGGNASRGGSCFELQCRRRPRVINSVPVTRAGRTSVFCIARKAEVRSMFAEKVTGGRDWHTREIWKELYNLGQEIYWLISFDFVECREEAAGSGWRILDPRVPHCVDEVKWSERYRLMKRKESLGKIVGKGIRFSRRDSGVTKGLFEGTPNVDRSSHVGGIPETRSTGRARAESFAGHSDENPLIQNVIIWIILWIGV